MVTYKKNLKHILLQESVEGQRKEELEKKRKEKEIWERGKKKTNWHLSNHANTDAIFVSIEWKQNKPTSKLCSTSISNSTSKWVVYFYFETETEKIKHLHYKIAAIIRYLK